MKKYFYTDGTNKYGPFSLEELKEENISKNTLVWFQDIEDWTPAGQVEELNEIFVTTPPITHKEKIEYSEIIVKNNSTGIVERVSPERFKEMTQLYGEDKYTILSYIDKNGNKISANSSSEKSQKPPKTYLVESILVTMFCCMPLGIVGIVNAAKVESRFYAGDIEGAKRASEEAEKWTKIGFWIGIIVAFVYVIVLLFYGRTGL